MRIYELQEKIAALEAEMEALKQKQQASLAPNTIIIEKLYVKKVDVDKLEFKLDGITVDELSGMLNVGINSDGTMKKTEKNK